MTKKKYKEEYFEKHIPHRIILLTTFLERYNPLLTETYISPDLFPDLFCCSKDISMMMVRFLLGELGVNLKREKDNPFNDINIKFNPKFGIKQLEYDEIKNDSRYLSIFEVLKAANRAVAHVEEKDVNHPLRLEEDNHILFDAINFTLEKVKTNMFQAAGFDYQNVEEMLKNKRKNK